MEKNDKIFMISCPECGSYVQARRGIFAKKIVECACGNKIDIRQSKLVSQECPHCGNIVVYDRTKGDAALCPLCKHPINRTEDKIKNVEIACDQCGIRFLVDKGAQSFTCPVCSHVMENVQAKVVQDEIKKSGVPNLIKYEGDIGSIVWKHPIEDFNYGSQLIVHESQEAVFFRDGQALDTFGPGRYTLETQKLPLLGKALDFPTEPTGVFHSEVYFVNLSVIEGVKWGTDSRVRLFDPDTGMYFEIGARGEFKVCVSNSRKLLTKVVGTGRTFGRGDITGEEGRSSFGSLVRAQVKSSLAQTITDNKIPVMAIDGYLMELSDALREKLNAKFVEYGLSIPEFIVQNVMLPDDDPNFKAAKKLFADRFIKTGEADTDKKVAEINKETKIIEATGDRDAGVIKSQGEATSELLHHYAEAEGRIMGGYTYQDETGRIVATEMMKKANGGGGSSGGGSSIAEKVIEAGFGLGVASTVAQTTREVLEPVLDRAMSPAKNKPAGNTWSCSCGRRGLTSKFCPDCGAARPEPAGTWDCACGARGLTTKHCPDCGARRPDAE